MSNDKICPFMSRAHVILKDSKGFHPYSGTPCYGELCMAWEEKHTLQEDRVVGGCKLIP